jgi:hypothetical protein
MASDGLAKGVITGSEYAVLEAAIAARNEIIQVDVFDPVTYRTLKG